MPHNISEIDTSYTYNLHCPDATFTLASADGQIHRLVVWKACGVSDWLRIHQSVQRPDEPAFPAGDIRHLCISRDVVFPMYAVTEYRANVWNIEVRYAGGGESVIYPFQDKEQALGFQAMVTGYDVVSCLENTSVYLTYRKHGSFVPNALRTKAHPELAGLGEVQLWRRKPLATDTNLSLPLASPRTASSGTGTQQTRRISDNLSLCTDAAGQQFYLSRHVPNPILVIFVKDVKLGGYTMLRTDLPPLALIVKSNSVVLSPQSGNGEKTFPVRQLAVTSDYLARWNVCAMGAVAKVGALETLKATTLTLEPREDDPQWLEQGILQLQLKYAKDELKRARDKNAARAGREPEGADGVHNASMGSSGSSSSGSMTESNFEPLPILERHEPLTHTIPRQYLTREERTRHASLPMVTGAVELPDSSSPRMLLPTNVFGGRA